jgi:hypothetical protein
MNRSLICIHKVHAYEYPALPFPPIILPYFNYGLLQDSESSPMTKIQFILDGCSVNQSSPYHHLICNAQEYST